MEFQGLTSRERQATSFTYTTDGRKQIYVSFSEPYAIDEAFAPPLNFTQKERGEDKGSAEGLATVQPRFADDGHGL